MASYSVTDGTPLGFSAISVNAGSATGLTPPASCNRVLLTLATAGNINWRDDNVAPTPTVGNPLFAGNYIELNNQLSITQFQAIAQGATVTLNANFYYKQ